MTISISTQALAGAIEEPECIVVDVREMAAFNGGIRQGLDLRCRGGRLGRRGVFTHGASRLL